ncbi:MAG TPA: 3-isopropylmalate dehydratase small subunit [Bacteroidota bacterium]|nr:3-isopropylmalate dehydratase small subunit [Bacteroidota bacterium]
MIQGRVHRYGDNIDTDVIIPARYCTAFTEAELAPHALEDLDAGFVKKVRKGDILVAGRNFGCGSSRENAPIAIKGAGISCVVATSFARIFYRNSINIGLPIFECGAAVADAEDGDEMRVDPEAGRLENLTRKKSYGVPPFPAMIQEIINSGGMVEFAKKRIQQQKNRKQEKDV